MGIAAGDLRGLPPASHPLPSIDVLRSLRARDFHHRTANGARASGPVNSPVRTPEPRSRFASYCTVTVTVIGAIVTPVAVPETVTEYVPAGVPGLLGGAVPPLPQPALNPTTAISTSAPSSVEIRRRLMGTRKNSSAAAAIPPPIGSIRIRGNSSAAEAAVVFTVSVPVPAVVPESVPGLVTEQVGASETVEETEQANETDPLKPPPGVTVTVEVPEPPAVPMVIEPLSLNATVGVWVTACTVTATVVVCDATPDPVPVTVTLYEPEVVLEVEVTVNVAVPAVVPPIVTGVATEQVGAVAPVPVTAQPSATDPMNPPDGVTVMVDVPVAPPPASVIEPLLLNAMAGVAVAACTVTATVVV
jgi:hypothetical protein